MDYFNLAKLIKNVVYNFTRIFKYLSISLICVCFIVICLLLMSSSSHAYISNSFVYNGLTYNFFIPDKAWTTIQSLNEYGNLNYKMFVFTNSGRVEVYFLNKDYDIKMWINSNYDRIYSNYDTVINNFSCIHYIITESSGNISSVNRSETNFPNGLGYSFYKNGRNLYIYSDFTIYTNNSFSTVFYQAPEWTDPFVAPSLYPPASEETTEQDALTSGNFTFFIVQPRKHRKKSRYFIAIL